MSTQIVSDAEPLEVSDDLALALRGLHKTYHGFELGPLDLDVPRGYVVGLVGANGSGKTTTIGSIIGTVVPTGGRVTVPTMDRVGVVLDSPFFMPAWTPHTVEKAIRPFYPDWSGETYRTLLRRFGVAEGVKLKDMSRGTGMKLQLAAALAHDPELLILDEPTSGLDPVARDDVLDLLAEFMEDPTHAILISSHITTDLERIADYVTVLHGGRVQASAPTTDLLDAYRFVKGGIRDLTPERHAQGLGLRIHDAGFDALVPTETADTWDGDLVLERPTLDQVVIGLSKGPRSGGAR